MVITTVSRRIRAPQGHYQQGYGQSLPPRQLPIRRGRKLVVLDLCLSTTSAAHGKAAAALGPKSTRRHSRARPPLGSRRSGSTCTTIHRRPSVASQDTAVLLKASGALVREAESNRGWYIQGHWGQRNSGQRRRLKGCRGPRHRGSGAPQDIATTSNYPPPSPPPEGAPGLLRRPGGAGTPGAAVYFRCWADVSPGTQTMSGGPPPSPPGAGAAVGRGGGSPDSPVPMQIDESHPAATTLHFFLVHQRMPFKLSTRARPCVTRSWPCKGELEAARGSQAECVSSRPAREGTDTPPLAARCRMIALNKSQANSNHPHLIHSMVPSPCRAPCRQTSRVGTMFSGASGTT